MINSERRQRKVSTEGKNMKNAMKTYAEKLMAQAFQSVKNYQQAMNGQKDLPPARKNMLYGRYLADMDEAI